MTQASKSSRQRVAEHRRRLREQGLRPVQFWLPDVNSPEFKAEARRQSLLVANSPGEKEDQDFIDAISQGIFDDEGIPEYDEGKSG